MHTNRRVVITGIGPVTSLGIGKEEFWTNLLDGKFMAKPIPDSFEKNYNFKSKFYIPFPEFSPEDFNLSPRYFNIMEDSSKVSVIGSLLALNDAGLLTENNDLSVYENDAVSVIIGVGIGSMQTMFKSNIIHNFEDRPEILESVNLRPSYDRLTIPSTMPNSPSSWVSIFFKIKGGCYTLNSACSSGSFGIGEAFRKIKDGYTEMAITGGAECLKEKTGGVMRGFDLLDTLTKSEDGRPQPFSQDRTGFLFSEGGACILVLEEYQNAIQRGAQIYAEIIDFESNSDAHSIIQIEPDGKQIKKLMKKITNNKIIDYINVHGTATILNDKVECEAINEVFGSKAYQPLINSTKGIIGHTIGASGSIELAATALSIYHSKVHPNLSENTISDLNLIEKTHSTDIKYAISTSYGFGGHNCALLLGKVE